LRQVLISPEALRDQPGEHVDVLRGGGFEIRYPAHPQFARGLCSEQESIRELGGVHAVIAGGEFYSAALLDALPDLLVIARAGVGYDRVDVPAATSRGVALTITPNSNYEAVAEHALALMLAVAKSIVVNDRMVRSGGWTRRPPLPVRGRILGIWGLGRIGRSLSVRAKALGMHIIATDQQANRHFVQNQRIELVDFDTLLARSDFLSLHCPLNDETRGRFGADSLSKMKPGSVLINTARGELVIESALVESLNSGHLAGAGLDVFQQEPPPADHPLLSLNNIVVSPHLAGTDQRSMQDMAVEAAHAIVAVLQGRLPPDVVVNPGFVKFCSGETAQADSLSRNRRAPP
jgi:D-3-phosphoglycerate dehydrogenase / 2-oxoglutarate reductase